MSRTQPMTASAVVESCVVCGGPLSSKRVIIDGRIYHEGCCFKSHPPHTWEDYSRLSDEYSALKARIADIEAELSITRRCNEHVECLCRGDVMEMKKRIEQ